MKKLGASIVLVFAAAMLFTACTETKDPATTTPVGTSTPTSSNSEATVVTTVADADVTTAADTDATTVADTAADTDATTTAA